MAKPIYLSVITCDGDFDQIAEGRAASLREIKSLRAMGFVVKAKAFESWEAAQAHADKLQAR